MQIIKFSKREEWAQRLERTTNDDSAVLKSAGEVLDVIREEGDAAVMRYTEQFDKVQITDLCISEQEIKNAEKEVSQELKDAINLAIKNIQTFHTAQKFNDLSVEIAPGIL